LRSHTLVAQSSNIANSTHYMSINTRSSKLSYKLLMRLLAIIAPIW